MRQDLSSKLGDTTVARRVRHRRSRLGVSIPSAEAGGVRHRTGRRVGSHRAASRFNPLRRSGGRATEGAQRCCVRRPPFQSPPPKRGACDKLSSTSSTTSGSMILFQSPPPKRGACDAPYPRRGGAGGLLAFQSPPPKRGACDSPGPLTVRQCRACRSFNPLRRSGGRATAPRCHVTEMW